MGAVAVPKINVILALMCMQYDHNNVAPAKLGSDQICNTPTVHARMGRFMMWANIISGLGCAFSSPKMGALADRYGRKPLIAFSALGLLFGDVITIVAGWFPHRISVYWVLLEFGVGGLTGSFGATMALVQTYAADYTRDEARVTVFARIHACMYLGLALGPALGAMFIRVVGKGDMLSILYAASLCHAAFIGFVLFGIEESLSDLARSVGKTSSLDTSPGTNAAISKSQRWLRACNILRPLRILRPPLEFSSHAARHNLPILASIDGIAFGIQIGLASMLVLYSEYILGWKTTEASLFISITNAVRASTLTLVLPLLSRLASRRSRRDSLTRIGGHGEGLETHVWFSVTVIRSAILLELVSHVGFALADNGVVFTLAGIVAAGGAVISPNLQSIMTSYVDATRTGELLGTVSALHALSRTLIPASLQLVYSVTAATAPATVFWVLCTLFGSTFALSLWIRT